MTPRTRRRNLAAAVAFLAPNIIGFLAFTLVPLGVSLAMAFTNWDLKLHNRFKTAPIRFVGFDHFSQLLGREEFWKYLGNTLFLMMGLPIGIAASLVAALLLSRDARGGSARAHRLLIVSSVSVAAIALLCVVGAGATALTVLFTTLACAVLVGGVAGGTTVYRTMFYLPSFTAGVAVFILWSKIYNPRNGPLNIALRPVLDEIAAVVNAAPSWSIRLVAWLGALLGVALLYATLGQLRRMWQNGDLGSLAAALAAPILLAPVASAWFWLPGHSPAIILTAAALAAATAQAARALRGRDFQAPAMEGFGTAWLLGSGAVVVQFILLGLGLVVYRLPAMSADGLEPPQWLTQYHWAKPALMMMGLWAAVGSNSMLLYLAALSNVPQDLYEAADIDGAGRMDRFWHVTWPQLAPTTFFVIVMGCIGGLQGGFEMARTMTSGGPAGSTTVLSYYIYGEGFLTGRMGYASAIAWVLFLMTLVITIFNWKFGSRYVNS